MTTATQTPTATQPLAHHDLAELLLAGDARFTVLNTKTGNRFTYRVTEAPAREGYAPRKSPLFFVKVLTSSDNEDGYSYLGLLRDKTVYEHGKKSRISADAPSATVFAWFWDKVVRHQLPACIQVWHEGSCLRCNRTLTDPVSVERAIGPDCWKLMGRHLPLEAKAQTTINELFGESYTPTWR